MQLKVFLKLDTELVLPINYNHILQGIIYHSASSIDISHTKKLHNEGINADNYTNTNFKLFSFSKIIGKYKIVGKNIVFSESIFFEIRSVDPYFIFIVYEGLKKNGIKFKNKTFIPNLEISNKVITSDSIYIRMLSPIVALNNLPDGSKEFISPLNNNFSLYISNNFTNKYKAFYGTFPKSEIELIVADVSYKDKCVTKFKNIYLTAWNGFFYLKGEPEVLNFLYNVGLGSKNSQGFGLFNIIE